MTRTYKLNIGFARIFSMFHHFIGNGLTFYHFKLVKTSLEKSASFIDIDRYNCEHEAWFKSNIR